MKRIGFWLLVVGLLFAMTVPAAAKGKTPVGDPVSIKAGTPGSIPAGQPFHIKHGWSLILPDDGPPGRHDFRLEVDGTDVEEDFVLRTVSFAPPPYNATLMRSPEASHGENPQGQRGVTWSWVHNFPDGMPEGNVTFTGHWFAPCQDSCDRRNEMVEVFTLSHTVNFTNSTPPPYYATLLRSPEASQLVSTGALLSLGLLFGVALVSGSPRRSIPRQER